MKSVSIVIPVYNEEDNLSNLHREICQVCCASGLQFEVVIVDDGSKDRSAEIAASLVPVKLIQFRKNFGQTAAMDAGIKHAKYDYIVTMDGDRQNDPADIPRLIAHLEKQDLDVVSGWRTNRQDSFSKRLLSRGANLLRKLLINDGIQDSGCSLKIYKKECFEYVNLYGEMHRFIPALLQIKGFRVGEISVNHRPRVAGKTKYDWKRTVKGFVDMISVWFWNKYAVRPLHLLGGSGIVASLVGILFALWTTFLFFKGQDISDTVWPILAAFCLLTGLQLFVSGLLADILSKTYYEKTKDTPYVIKKIVENV
jgi:glycosyltransferase involved in cell wall biosynthesis